MDISCTNHITGNLAYFADIKYKDYNNYGGVGSSIKFEGISTVRILILGTDAK